MAPPVHLYIRETLDWGNEALVEERLIPDFRFRVDAWNATFTMPYRIFRMRLKAIAQSSLARVQGATLSALEDIRPGDLIVPLDDDDWVAPDLAVRLQAAYEPGVGRYLWHRELVEPVTWLHDLRRRFARFRGRPTANICKTNNYAVVNTPELRPLTAHHTTACQYFDQHPDGVKRIAATLAVQNRNVASQTTLRKALSSPADRHKLAALVEEHRPLYTRRLRRDLRWARPYFDEMVTLMAELRVK